MAKWYSAAEKIPGEGKLVLICYCYQHWVWNLDDEIIEYGKGEWKAREHGEWKDAIGYGVGCIWDNKWRIKDRVPETIIAWRYFPMLPKDFEKQWMEKRLQHRGKKSVVK